MKHHPLFAFLFAGALSLPLYAADMPAKSVEPGAELQNSAVLKAASFDHQFIDTMLYHHQIAVEMASMAESQATLPEVQEMARMVLESQQSLADQLYALRQQIYGDALEAVNMKMHGMQALKNVNVEVLQNAQGLGFDQQFVRMMIEHYKGGVAMAMTELSKGKQLEVKELAQAIIKTQAGKVGELRKIKQEFNLTKTALSQ